MVAPDRIRSMVLAPNTFPYVSVRHRKKRELLNISELIRRYGNVWKGDYSPTVLHYII